MKKTTYAGKSRQDLIKNLLEKREAFRKLKFSTSGSKTRNVKEGGSIKKDIARILTALSRNKE